jgi:hypothetical protein
VVGQSSYAVDGQTMQMDAQTFIENNRTYVPVRYLALALGVAEKDIIWQSPNVTLKLADTELKLAEGSKTLYKNGQQIQMDVVVLNRKGRTYLPARWVAEAFGYQVKWQPETQTVLIGPPEKPEEIQNAPFPVQLIKLEMEVGSRKAIGTPSITAAMENPNTADQAKKIRQKYEDIAYKEILKMKEENPDWQPSDQLVKEMIEEKIRLN